MIRFLPLLLFLVMAFHSLQGQKVHHIKFRIDHKSELDSVTRMISIDDVRDGMVYAYATGEQMERIRRNTPYDVQLLPLPGNKRLKTAAISADMSGWDAYPSYGQYEAMMDSMASAYPDICELDTIGKTVLGRSLLVMRITDHPGREEDEPELFYTSTMHGNEAAGYVLMLRLIDTLLTSYGQDERITNLVDSIDIFINPHANPDGTYGDDDQTLSEASRYNANGVDLNRNFPDPQDGPHPDGQSWQPETRAMMDFAKKQHITLSANFHGGAEVANYPWDTWGRAHTDSTWLAYVSRIYAGRAQEDGPPGYFTSITPSGIIHGYDWYPISGGRQDYMTYFHQAREVTLEISDDKMPPASTLPDYWDYNREALLSYMEACLHGIRGEVADEWGNPLKAMVEVVGHEQDMDSSMVFTDADVGDYHRMIDTGRYDLRFSAAGYRDTIIPDIRVNHNRVQRTDVVMHRAAPPKLSFFPDTLRADMAMKRKDTLRLTMKNTGGMDAQVLLEVQDSTLNPWLKPGLVQKSIESGNQDTMIYQVETPEADTLLQTNILASLKGYDRDTLIPVRIRVDMSHGLEEHVAVGHFLCYPNPFRELLRLEVRLRRGIKNLEIHLADAQGRIVYTVEKAFAAPGLQQFNLNLGGKSLPPGIYHIRIRAGSQSHTRKLLHLH